MDIIIDGEEHKIFGEKTAEEILIEAEIESVKEIMAVKINNEICDLSTVIDEDKNLETIRIDTEYGNRIYRRSLYLVMAKAVYELFPDTLLKIRMSISYGVYC